MSTVYYVYVDEAGQYTTQGDAFHVGAVIVGAPVRDDLQQRIQRIEQSVGKRGKWNGCSVAVKTSFLQAVFDEPPSGLYWHRSRQRSGYLEVTAAAAARAMQRVTAEDSQFLLIIDALKKSTRQRVSRILREHHIRWRAIHVDKRDEMEPLLRLADAIAGFVRDVHHEKPYVQTLWGTAEGLLEKV